MNFFTKNATIINSKLVDYFESLLSHSKNTTLEKEVLEHIKEFTLRGGKRIRASLVEVGFRLFQRDEKINSNILDTIHKVGIVMELLQSFFLIHDDIIDKAPLRRGLETLHLTWAKKYNNDLHMGESMGILAGNYALVKAYKIIQELKGILDSVKLDLTGLIHQVIEETLAGQIIDVEVAVKKIAETTEKDIIDIMTLKTAKYTIVAPLQFGAIIAGASKEKMEKISSFGVPLGLAFQISDDIIGTFGKEEKTGKSINSDLKEGKKTLFIIDSYKKCNDDEKDRMLNVLGKENLPDDQYNLVRDLVKKYNSLKYAQKKIESYAKEGETKLNNFNCNKDAKKIINDLAFQQIHRSS
ncbi:MAG: Geranylgeranyl diphosphate synthase [Candidatus Heimdallarchaeota archaeon LC_3]|nr:MAG: Geranylgeranyl diphosphate synthase [Candidatus Heimdallarchaeota archaeon LC_3]